MTKIIKCLHCGSPSYTEIRPGTYQCQHCDSTFSVDAGETRIGLARMMTNKEGHNQE